jgi:hypothetical protein
LQRPYPTESPVSTDRTERLMESPDSRPEIIMYHRHPPAATTHTVELRQVQEINLRLGEPARAEISAESIGVAGQPTATAVSFPLDLFGTEARDCELLRPSATLRHVSAEGSPQFPYVLGHFSARPAGVQRAGDPGLVIELHSDVLHRLSIRLGLRHCWGTDAVLAGNAIRGWGSRAG